MTKEDYEIIANGIDISIGKLTKHYNKEERRWLLDSQDEVENIQASIRELKHRKTIAWEAFILETADCPAILKKMFDPIVRKRNSDDSRFPNKVEITDGSRFTFPNMGERDFQPKHLKGFWSCPGCMLSMDNQELLDYPNYRKQITWCPQFLPTVAMGKNPEEYKAFIRKINPDVPYCYAGLLHSELQTSSTEIKLVKYCDSCEWASIETKQLAEPLDPQNYSINLDPASTGVKDYTSIICKCNECKELIFEEDSAKVLAADGKSMLPEYEKMLDDHYKERHHA